MRTLCLGLYVFTNTPLTEREPDKIVSSVQLSIVFNQTTNLDLKKKDLQFVLLLIQIVQVKIKN